MAGMSKKRAVAAAHTTKRTRAPDGKWLEELVAFVERNLLPPEAKVVRNHRVNTANGYPYAEYDVMATGRLGSTDFRWLFQCRDRPSSGAEGVSWIRELHGLRLDVNLDRVVAVSTTGFSKGARQSAARVGIELRTVRRLDLEQPPEAEDWMRRIRAELTVQMSQVRNVQVFTVEHCPQMQPAMYKLLSSRDLDAKVLRDVNSGTRLSLNTVFMASVTPDHYWQGLREGGPAREVQTNVVFPSDEPVTLETEDGPVRLQSVIFDGLLSIRASTGILSDAHRYQTLDTSESHCEVAEYLHEHGNTTMIARRLNATGDIHVDFASGPKDMIWKSLQADIQRCEVSEAGSSNPAWPSEGGDPAA